MRTEKLISQMLELARELGNPNREYVLFGNGNVSGKADYETFWVKASHKKTFASTPARMSSTEGISGR